MGIIKAVKRFVPSKYKRRVKESLGVPSLHWSLQNLKRKNFRPSSVIDIGAYEGYWALDMLEVFPSAKILMVEAQKNKASFLEKIKIAFPKTDFSISLLSSEDGTEKLFCHNETASHISQGSFAELESEVLVTQTLDSLLKEKKFPLPDFLKLDVQGHELEVLKGANESLSHAEVCLLEISIFDFGEGTPLLLEMVNYMDSKGFQAYDISQLMRRPLDKLLFQVDMFFVKKNSYLVSDKSW